MDIDADILVRAPQESAMFGLIRAKQSEMAARIRAESDGTKVNPANATEAENTTRGTERSADGLSEEERAVVDQLRARDREVRDHEQAHKRVGGPYASSPTYSYQTGPDGQRYAVGGQVLIDASPVPENPEATIAKMMIVKAAALAPAEPSSADRNVAAMADAQLAQAQADLNAMKSEELRGETLDTYA